VTRKEAAEALAAAVKAALEEAEGEQAAQLTKAAEAAEAEAAEVEQMAAKEHLKAAVAAAKAEAAVAQAAAVLAATTEAAHSTALVRTTAGPFDEGAAAAQRERAATTLQARQRGCVTRATKRQPDCKALAGRPPSQRVAKQQAPVGGARRRLWTALSVLTFVALCALLVATYLESFAFAPPTVAPPTVAPTRTRTLPPWLRPLTLPPWLRPLRKVRSRVLAVCRVLCDLLAARLASIQWEMPFETLCIAHMRQPLLALPA
jgi:hypothetical protein